MSRIGGGGVALTIDRCIRADRLITSIEHFNFFGSVVKGPEASLESSLWAPANHDIERKSHLYCQYVTHLYGRWLITRSIHNLKLKYVN